MASPLIYKCEPRNPNKSVRGLSMPKWAHKYVLYMGRREGVVNNEDRGHGLFGRLDTNNGGEFGAIDNISATARYVEQKTKDGTWLYDNVVSIAKEDFERLGYDNLDAWKQLAKDNALKMADAVGIPASRVEYVAAMHIDDNKPNFHLLFWDKEQGVRSYFNYAKTFEKTRASLTKYVYEDDIREFSETKTKARDAMLEKGKDWGKDAFDPLYKMRKSDFASIKEEATSDEVKADPTLVIGKVLNRNIPNSYLDEMRLKIIQLMEKLPEKGRLSHKLLPPDVKLEVEALATDIIKELSESNPDFKAEFDAYKKSARDLAKLYHAEKVYDKEATETEKTGETGVGVKGGYIDNPKGIAAIDRAEKKAEADLIKRLSNQLLKNIKNIDYQQYLYGKEEYSKHQNKARQRNATMNLLSLLFRSARNAGRAGRGMPTGPKHWGTTERIEARRDYVKNIEAPRSPSSDRRSNSNSWGCDGDEQER